MIYLKLFYVFFYTNLLGYGGGPATIPLIEKEVVKNQQWMSTEEFSHVLGLSNALPGPIATKMAGYIGYSEAGILGSFISVFATIMPSLVLMMVLLSILNKFKDSPRVKRLSTFVLPTIAVLMAQLASGFTETAILDNGAMLSVICIAIAFTLMEYVKISPILCIVAGLILGGLFL